MIITVAKIALIVSGLAIICLYLPPLIINTSLNAGNLFGYAVGAILVLAGILLNRIIDFIRHQAAIGNGKAVFGVLIFLAAAALIFITAFFITLGIIISHSRTNAREEKVLIILGCRIRGSEPSKALVLRAEAAANYLLSHPNTVAIASGGQGRDESLSEGECISNLLLEKGIDKSRIFIEDKSTSTDENISFSKEIMEKHSLGSSAAIATSEYHQYRACLICKRHKIHSCSVSSASSPKWKATYFTREVFGVWKEWIGIRDSNPARF